MAEINSFLDPKAQEEVKEYIVSLEKIAGQYKSIAENAIKLEKVKQEEQKTEQQLLKTKQQAEVLTQKKIKTQQDEQRANDKLQAQQKKIIAQTEKENSAYERLNKQHQDAIKNARELGARYGTTSKRAQEAAAQANKLGKELKQIKNLTGAPATNNVGKYFQAMVKFAGSLGLVTGGVALLKKGFEGITKGSQSAGDAWNRTMGSMKASTDAFFSMLGSGNLENFTKRLRDAAKAGREYADSQDDLFEGGLSLKIAEAESRKIIAQQEIIRDNQQLTNEQRIAAAELINAEEEKILARRQVELGKAYESEAKRIEGVKGLNRDMLIDFIKEYRNTEEIRASIAEKQAQEEIALKILINTAKSGLDASAEQAKVDEIRKSYTVQERIYQEFLKTYGESTDDEVKRVIDSYTAIVEADARSIEERRRNATKLSGFYKVLRKENEDFADKSVKALSTSIAGGIASPENLTIVKRDVNKLMDEIGLAIDDSPVTFWEKFLAIDDSMKLEMAQQFVGAIGDMGNALFELGQSDREREIASIESYYDKRIEAARAAGEDTTALERELQIKRAKLDREQAKSEKNQAYFSALLNIAEGITSALSNPVTAPFVIPFITTLGGIQIATIANQPLPEIPSFFKGTDSAPDGKILFGEAGREIVIPESGKAFIADKPTIADGLAGAKILSNPMTEAILRGEGGDTKTIEKKLDKLIGAVEKNKANIYIDKRLSRHVNLKHINSKYGRN